jgi:hypothetical protein
VIHVPPENRELAVIQTNHNARLAGAAGPQEDFVAELDHCLTPLWWLHAYLFS